jgi:sec-independent protein translocase protein TatB
VFLFILESIGTTELILIGIVALIFLGPRKLPEMARKIGKVMAEFRGTASEFKETWQREVSFEEEAKAFDLNALDAEPVPRVETVPSRETTDAASAPAGKGPDAPSIKEIDPASFDHLVPAADAVGNKAAPPPLEKGNDKKNWL